MPRAIEHTFARIDDVWCRTQTNAEPESVDTFCARLVERGMGDAADALRGILRRADNFNAKRLAVSLKGVKWGEPDYSTEESPEQAERRGRLEVLAERMAALEAQVGAALQQVTRAAAAADEAVGRVTEADAELHGLAAELQMLRPDAGGPVVRRLEAVEQTLEALRAATEGQVAPRLERAEQVLKSITERKLGPRLDRAEKLLKPLGEAHLESRLDRVEQQLKPLGEAQLLRRLDHVEQTLQLARPEDGGPAMRRLEHLEESLAALDTTVAEMQGRMGTLHAEVSANGRPAAGPSPIVDAHFEALDERVDRVLGTLDHERKAAETMRARLDELDRRTHGPVHADAVAKALMDDLRRATDQVRRRLEEAVGGTPRHVIEQVQQVVEVAGLAFDDYVSLLTDWVERRKNALAPGELLERFGDGTTASELAVLVGLVVVEAGMARGDAPPPEALVVALFRDAYAQRPDLPESLLAPLSVLCREADLEPLLPRPGVAFDGAKHLLEGAEPATGMAAGVIARLVRPGFARLGTGQVLHPAVVVVAE